MKPVHKVNVVLYLEMTISIDSNINSYRVYIHQVHTHTHTHTERSYRVTANTTKVRQHKIQIVYQNYNCLSTTLSRIQCYLCSSYTGKPVEYIIYTKITHSTPKKKFMEVLLSV